jgi:predicted AAA+ superfamily ATPase
MDRPCYLDLIDQHFEVHPVVAILGPRQCGKTTLARMYAERHEPAPTTRFDLEDPTDLAALANPKLALQGIGGLVVIDEVQHVPELFRVIRVLVDRPGQRTRFLVLGSASRDLIRQSSESLAGRISHLEIAPFGLDEVGHSALDRLWLRGGYPPSFLARSDPASGQWRKSYVSTFLERDLPALGISIPPATLRRFWMMLAHYHGQIMNFSEVGRSFGAADTTVRRYLDILSGTFMVRQLPPWFENIGKRQVKAPKIYLRDSGLFHTLLGIRDKDELLRHPKLGASWEGLAIDTVIRHHRVGEGECYFWSTYGRAALDLLIVSEGRRIGYEVEYTETPRVTRSMQTARSDLGLDDLRVVYPGERCFPLAEGIDAMGLAALPAEDVASRT